MYHCCSCQRIITHKQALQHCITIDLKILTLSVYDGWSMLEVESQPLRLGGVAMEGRLQCSAKEGVQE